MIMMIMSDNRDYNEFHVLRMEILLVKYDVRRDVYDTCLDVNDYFEELNIWSEGWWSSSSINNLSRNNKKDQDGA